jgi:hypothetical protein
MAIIQDNMAINLSLMVSHFKLFLIVIKDLIIGNSWLIKESIFLNKK